MLSTKSSDLHHKTLLIKQDDKFFTRLLSRELSMTRNNSKIGSFRGLPSSVPFVWECQPGTPKHRFHSADEYAEPLPPLTPPPSFYSTAANGSKSSKIKRQRSLNALFHKLNIIKKSPSSSTVSSTTKQPSSSPTISSHSTSSSSVWSSSGSSSCNRRSRFGSWGGYSSSSSGKLDEEDENCINASPTSTLCFMIRKKHNKSMNLQKKGLIHAHETMF